MQDKVFSLNWELKYVGHFKFMYEAPNQSASKQTALKRTMWSQTKTCIDKSSCDICILLRYYAAYSGNSLQTFW